MVGGEARSNQFSTKQSSTIQGFQRDVCTRIIVEDDIRRSSLTRKQSQYREMARQVFRGAKNHVLRGETASTRGCTAIICCRWIQQVYFQGSWRQQSSSDCQSRPFASHFRNRYSEVLDKLK